jgi:hypothetical protein
MPRTSAEAAIPKVIDFRSVRNLVHEAIRADVFFITFS